MNTNRQQAPSPPSDPASERGVAGRPKSPRGWNPSYRAKLLVGVCGLVLFTGTVVIGLAYRSARASTEALIETLFREVSGHAVTHTRNFVLRAVPVAESLQHLAGRELALTDSDHLANQLLAFLEGNPGLSWVSYSDEEGTFTGVYRPVEGGLRLNQSRIVDGRTHLVERDVLPSGSLRLARREDDSGYDPRTRPFYRKAKQEGRLVWLPPYVFYNQGVPGISCATPVSGGTGKLRGVLSIDFDLNALSEFVAGLSVSEHSKVFLFTANDLLLAHPDQKMRVVTGQRGAGSLPTLRDVGDPLVDAYRENLRPEHLQVPGFHLFGFHLDGGDYLASATTFRVSNDLDWVVGAVAPKTDFLGDVWRSQNVALSVAGVAVLVAMLFAATLARLVSGPVLALIGFMRRVGDGDLEAKADLGGSSEFRQLSEALNRMIADLRDRLRLRHSLNVAMEVQQRLLPQRPPRVRGLDIAGHSTYCDETGGDYYDFLILDEAAPDHVLVALGDVMGHGVAAALVMAGARAVLRDRAGTAGGLADLISHLNRLLAADHEGTRFMTMHLSVIDVPAGLYRWVSAGHDPALVFDPAANRFEELEGADIPLGIIENTDYEEHRYGPLRPGHVITIGTDGIWEMPNAAGEQFGKDRLREAIRSAAGGTASDITQSIRDRLTSFRGDCRPVDDVTLVVIKVVAGGP